MAVGPNATRVEQQRQAEQARIQNQLAHQQMRQAGTADANTAARLAALGAAANTAARQPAPAPAPAPATRTPQAWEALMPDIPFLQQAMGNTAPSAASLSAQAARYAGQVASPAGTPARAPLGSVSAMDADYPWSSQSSIVSGGAGVVPARGGGSGGGGGGGGGDGGADPTPRGKTAVEEYSDEGAALSAELFGQLAARRRAADEELQFAMEREATQTQRLNLAATTAREQVRKEFRNLTEDMMRMLAGRGTARAPMVAGRGARRLQMAQDERFGQISQTLADEISALQEMVQMAERERNRVVATISQEEALLRTAPNLLLPAAAAFGGR